MKRVVTVLLALCLLISLAPNVFAQESAPSNLPPMKKYSEEQYDKEDILALEKYVSVKDGYFVLDSSKAKSDGFKNDLVDGQQKYFEFLNSEISAGNLTVDKNLNITGQTQEQKNFKPADAEILKCKGKTTKSKTYWWGYSRKLNSCDSKKVATSFSSASSVAAGIAVAAAWFGIIPSVPPGLSAAYFGLVASRINANNNGKGVIADMTWAVVFNIKPQK
ncbi:MULTISPECIES: hypothetical protein [Bacteria]|uniref:hypothetical protein n=2 Tax=cellular organisms TaxID=131567 RepID=UPI0011E7EC15|nr:hypothetical protein [Campylobacter concisus]MCY7782726.1 hypothetical protein [Bacillus sp. S20C3]MCY8720972.1 hypothetical protein [Bacillus sp. S10C12M]MCY8782684.1 hypothetical protein [Bacillus spizizenii]MED1938596.1 hypothetical protein [Bacillus subtilis]